MRNARSEVWLFQINDGNKAARPLDAIQLGKFCVHDPKEGSLKEAAVKEAQAARSVRRFPRRQIEPVLQRGSFSLAPPPCVPRDSTRPWRPIRAFAGGPDWLRRAGRVHRVFLQRT